MSAGIGDTYATLPYNPSGIGWLSPVASGLHILVARYIRRRTMGRPVVHWEFCSQNPDQASAFYAKAFDWNIRAQETGPMKYWTVDTENDSGINGGIMKPDSGPVPGSMSIYW